MIRKLLKNESGYSLVEVMASIVILTLAIVPMVGMFDMGLKTATTGSNYDKARALANLKLEQAKTLPYATVKGTFPENTGTTTSYNGAGRYQSAWKTESGAAAAKFNGFEYRVQKQYLKQPSTAPASASESFANSNGSDPNSTDPSGNRQDLIRVTVTVRWGDGGTTFATSGVVAK